MRCRVPISSDAPRRRGAIFRTLAIVGLVAATPTLAHPIHRSIAEADFNADKRTLQVAVRVFADDFEDALSAHAKKKISLEKTPAIEIDAAARAYLAERFIIKSPDGSLAAQHWIGRELKDAENEVWMYFEVTLPGIEGARIHHALLSEHFRDQLNSVLVRDGPRKTTLVFLPSHREKIVRFPPQSL